MYISQCTSDDDVITFRRIVRNSINIPGSEIPQDKLSGIPFGNWYFEMNRVQRDRTVGPDKITLRPETDIDRHELKLWLSSLLHRLHSERVR